MEPMPSTESFAGNGRKHVAMSMRSHLKQTWGRPLLWTGVALACIFGILVASCRFSGQYTMVVSALRFGINATVLFFSTSAIGTCIVVLLPPLRKLVPFAWRIWLWGTLGFTCGFLLPDGVLVAVLMIVAITTGKNPLDSVTGSALALYFLPPVGAVMGGVLGIALGHSSARHSIDSGSPGPVVEEAHEA